MPNQNMLQGKANKSLLGGAPGGFRMPPEPSGIAADNSLKVTKTPSVASNVTGHPKVPLTPQLVNSIKNSPKGKIPAGLQKYLAAHKKKGGKKK